MRDAEDGSQVGPGFYDSTDYNGNGVPDQNEGFGPVPDPAAVRGQSAP